MTEAPPQQNDPNHANREAENNAPQLGEQPFHHTARTENKKTCNKLWHTNDFPMLIVTILGVLAVLAYTRVTRQQLSVMQGQLNISENTLIATQRPWVAIKAITITSPLIFEATPDDHEGRVDLTFVTKTPVIPRLCVPR